MRGRDHRVRQAGVVEPEQRLVVHDDVAAPGAVLELCSGAGQIGLLAVAGSAPAATASSQERPNIVLIQTDDEIVSDLKYMPNVRRLLDEGALGVVGARYLLEDSSVETLQTLGVK